MIRILLSIKSTCLEQTFSLLMTVIYNKIYTPDAWTHWVRDTLIRNEKTSVVTQDFLINKLFSTSMLRHTNNLQRQNLRCAAKIFSEILSSDSQTVGHDTLVHNERTQVCHENFSHVSSSCSQSVGSDTLVRS